MKAKNFLFRLFMLFAALNVLIFTSCNSDSDSEPEVYYHVNFYGNYDGADSLGYRSAAPGESITTLSYATRKGYHLKGWAEKADATSPDYTPGQSITVNDNLSLYAVWEKIESFTITYDANFIAADASQSQTKTQTVSLKNDDEKAVLEANTFTRDGYIFLGWGTSSSSSTVSYYDEAKTDIWDDTTLYALWGSRSAYIQLTFNKNDGNASPEEKVYYMKKNSSFNLPAAPFEREGYTFSGWK